MKLLRKTTLLEGRVKINSTTESRVLTPGQQAEIENGQQIILSKNVDVEQAVAWKNGIFNFKDADLPMVMRQLSRWYDLEVQYKGSLPKREFQGKLGRDLQLSQVLKVLTRMQVKYTRDGRVITIEGN